MLTNMEIAFSACNVVALREVPLSDASLPDGLGAAQPLGMNRIPEVT